MKAKAPVMEFECRGCSTSFSVTSYMGNYEGIPIEEIKVTCPTCQKGEVCLVNVDWGNIINEDSK